MTLFRKFQILMFKIKYFMRFHITTKRSSKDYFYAITSSLNNDLIKENLKKMNVDYFYADIGRCVLDRMYKIHKSQISKLPSYPEDKGCYTESNFLPIGKQSDSDKYWGNAFDDFGIRYEVKLLGKFQTNWIEVKQ